MKFTNMDKNTLIITGEATTKTENVKYRTGQVKTMDC